MTYKKKVIFRKFLITGKLVMILKFRFQKPHVFISMNKELIRKNTKIGDTLLLPEIKYDTLE